MAETNWSQGMQSGMQGAQMGGQVGGAWGAVIGGVIGGVLGLTHKDAELEMIKKYNQDVVKNTAQDLFDMRRAQNVENIRTQQAMQAYSDSQRTQAATFNADFGSADIIGASSEALAKVLDFQTVQAQAQVMANWETGVDNYNAGIRRTTNMAMQGLRRSKGDNSKVDYAGMTQQGMAMYKQYSGGTTTNKSVSGGGLGSFSDFGSFGKSGSSSGSFGGGAMSA